MVQILGLDMEIFNKEVVRLIRLYLLGSISEKEWEKLEQWIEADDGNRRFFEDMTSSKESTLFMATSVEVRGGNSYSRGGGIFCLVLESGGANKESRGKRVDRAGASKSNIGASGRNDVGAKRCEAGGN